MSKDGVFRAFTAGTGIVLGVAMAAACATSTAPPGTGGGGSGGDGGSSTTQGGGGQGGDGGTVSQGGQGGTTSSTGGGGAAEGGSGGEGGSTVCGDNVIEPPESCEGTDFGGKSCETFGLGPGQLQCNSFCQIVVSGCAPPENCNNGFDDDGDGFIDCQDSDCATLAQCTDSCAAPIPLIFPGFDFRSTVGRPDITAASCGAGTGSELIFSFTAPSSADAYVSVSGQADFSVAVTTACGDSLTEVACKSTVTQPWTPENLTFSMTQGVTYFILVDGNGPSQASDFSLEVNYLPGPETFCDDLWDDDFDGFVDCDDPTACQTTPTCIPGTGAYGTPCFSNGNCAANQNDPVCLNGFQFNFPNGYCSEFCDLNAPDCSGDGVCYALGISQNGVCLDGCLTNADCAVGTACVEMGLSSKVCWIPPETGVFCTNVTDDDGDFLTDCEDPSNCQSDPQCTPGPGLVGSSCAQHNQCSSNTGNDPLCLDAFNFGFPGGYCSEFCDVLANDCAPGAVCGNWFGFPSGAGTCFKTCLTNADCPSGLFCNDFGFGLHCNF
ncbi:MAG: hypothetical protein R3B72_28010 [Polyangiaceae bacterium]